MPCNLARKSLFPCALFILDLPFDGQHQLEAFYRETDDVAIWNLTNLSIAQSGNGRRGEQLTDKTNQFRLGKALLLLLLIAVQMMV
mmetsp:Transcript_42175/g.68461  ORF Transcript_42175/g.68461 Transcript_42175/m.68461 type:complete len:86 (+) Transcript_42175:232-489(+)